MASYLSNILKTTTSPLTTLNTSILNQARNAMNSARYFAVASSKKKIVAAKARPALTSGKKSGKAKKPIKTASKTTAAAKKAEKAKKDRTLQEKEKEKLKAKKEKERASKKAESEKAKEKLQAQKEKAKKEKEAEKEKVARQKEKEKERAQKAKDIAQEKKEKEKIKQALIKADKDKRPKRLPNAYSLFYTEKFKGEGDSLKGKGRERITEFAKSVAEKWRALDDTSKQVYQDEIAKRRPAYEEARKKYLAEKKASASRKLTPYNKFIQQNFSKVKEGNPNKPTSEIMKLIGAKWNDLSAAEKQRLAKQ